MPLPPSGDCQAGALGEAALCRSDLHNRFGERAVIQIAAIENAGFVEMHMRIDEAGNDELAGDVLFGRIGSDVCCNQNNAAAGDREVDDLFATADARVAKNIVERRVVVRHASASSSRRLVSANAEA